MKKIYLFTFSILSLGQITAQTTHTLTQANTEPIINDTYDSNVLDTTNALPMTVSGTNVIWDITGISESGGINTNSYVDPTSDAGSVNYPGTTIVEAGTAATSYFKSSANLYELLGVDAGMFILNYNTNSAIVASYPITMGYTNNDVAAGTMAVPSNSLYGTFTSTIQTTADATGTLSLTTTAGSVDLTNCLRVKSSQMIDFSLAGGFVSGTIDMTIYNYYNSSSKFPLFTVNYMHVVAGGPSPIDQRIDEVSKQSTVLFVGLNESKKDEVIFKAYPNPANHEVSVHFVLTQNDSYNIEITNTLGQVVKTVSMKNLQPGVYNETINLSGLTAGIYNVKVSGNKVQGTEKLVIQ